MEEDFPLNDENLFLEKDGRADDFSLKEENMFLEKVGRIEGFSLNEENNLEMRWFSKKDMSLLVIVTDIVYMLIRHNVLYSVYSF